MIARFLALVIVSIVAVWPGGALAQGDRASPSASSILSKPMIIYLASGARDACGPGCSEWIAAEGAFNLGVAQRLQTFVSRHRGKNLPVFFDSPGGLQKEAMQIGRFLRERRMTVGVWKTVPDGCVKADEKACQALKTTNNTVKAGLQFGACNSACLYAIVGGWVRQIPPGARIGVHSAKHIGLRSDGRIVESPSVSQKVSAEFQADYRKYFREMGIDPRLPDTIAQTPFERVHVLSRDEIADFGIDTRRFSETPWLAVGRASEGITVMKLIVEAKGSEQNQYRVSGFRLGCGGQQRALVLYFRGLASDEIGKPARVLVALGPHKVDLSQSGAGRKIDALDNNGSFGGSAGYVPFEYFEQAATRDGISIAVSNPAASTVVPQDKKLSTQGLSDAIRTLRERCASTT